jgi:hypothetical protein
MDRLWLLVPLAVSAYCAVQAIRDFRGRNYIMAGLGVVCLAALLLAPIPTHAVRIGPF